MDLQRRGIETSLPEDRLKSERVTTCSAPRAEKAGFCKAMFVSPLA